MNEERPLALEENRQLRIKSTRLMGNGFIISEEQLDQFSEGDRNKEIFKPYLSASDFNSNPNCIPDRWVIDFGDRTEFLAEDYDLAYCWVKDTVKHERARLRKDSDGKEIPGSYVYPDHLAHLWWQFGERQTAWSDLRRPITRMIGVPTITKYINYHFIGDKPIVGDTIYLIARDQWWEFAVLQSSIHQAWVYRYGSNSRGIVRVFRGSCLDNFPFPTSPQAALQEIGEAYYQLRSKIMSQLDVGLSKVSKLFHTQELPAPGCVIDSEQILKGNNRTLKSLYQRLEIEKAGSISFAEAVSLIHQLRALQIKMDQEVLAAYGWDKDTEEWGEGIDLVHGFYEQSDLPEDESLRFTLADSARKEILKRLVVLNRKYC